MPFSQSFAYDGLTVRVECPDQAHLTWLEEFLVPSFSLVEEEAVDCVVTLEIDDHRHEALLRAGAQPGGGCVRGFVLDGGPIEMTSWMSPGADRVLFDADSAVFYFVDQDTTHIRILSASRYLSRRLALMRVVRELAMSRAWTRRRFVLHAGACVVGNTGIIIAGPKGAGKTTLLMYALGAKGAQFIANDRLVVDAGGSHALAWGMPTVVSVRKRTLERCPAFTERWELSGYNERLALREATAPRAAPPRPDAINLTPAQFCMLLGLPSLGSAPAHVLLFPRLTDGIEGFHAQELPAEIASQRLAASIFAASASQISEVFALPARSSPPDGAIVRQLSRTLLSQVRAFDCVLGQPAPHTAETIRDFLGTLPAEVDAGECPEFEGR